MRIVAVFLLLAIQPNALTKDWNGLSPLHSNRQDVERLLGKSKSGPNDAFIGSYETSVGHVSVIYSWKNCENGSKEDWNVPLGTVLNIIVSPRGDFRISELGFDLALFEKTTSAHMPSVVYYTNKEDGFSLR